ncbi:MAG: ATP--guanido phosphotransferase [Clostridia bacterium]|nr:ATP--guanido phosphotransferase [Clostridia bacterium]MBR1704925.1 ATP--guanido phosphotransferase [Clostridia bacterium]
MTKWYMLSGKENDVAVSSKVSLARNLRNHVFTSRLSAEEKEQIAREVTEAVSRQLPDKMITTHMEELTPYAAISLAERNLVSPEFVSVREGRTFLMTPDESLSLMICEEDHVKIQALLPGLELGRSFELADRMDTLLDEALGFSFDPKLGYLTQCPTNIGTAMRGSVILQLPAMRILGRVRNLSTTVSRLGLILTGAYGEGDSPTGSLYLLTNQVTLGISEEAALQNLESLALSILEQEREARKELMENLQFQDMLWRSYGTLKSARVMNFQEFMEALSVVKVGIAAGEFDLPMNTVNELIFAMQPATLNTEAGRPLDRQERDALRAEKVRAVFA